MSGSERIDSSGDYDILRVLTSPGDRALLFHDVHFPIHDPGCMDVVVEAAQVLGCNIAVANGDIFDALAVSSHRRPARQALQYGSLELEAEVGEPYLRAIRSAIPYCIYKRGNHEERVERLVDENPGLAGLEWYEPFAQAVEGWDCLPGDCVVKLGGLNIFHGHEITGTLRKHPATAVLSAYPGQNTYFGHCHKIDVATTPTSKDGRQVVHGAWTGGHLADPRKMGYAASFRQAWQQGFSVVEQWENGLFTVHPTRIFRDTRGMPLAHVLGKTLRG